TFLKRTRSLVPVLCQARPKSEQCPNTIREEINMLSRLCFVTVLLLTTNPAYAQLGTGAISGTIFDQTGAVLPGANVTVTNTGTGFIRDTVSSETGDYRLAGLLPGTYELVVELAGFSRFVRSNLTVQVDQNARIEVRLQVGNPTENVIVIEQA